MGRILSRDPKNYTYPCLAGDGNKSHEYTHDAMFTPDDPLYGDSGNIVNTRIATLNHPKRWHINGTNN